MHHPSAREDHIVIADGGATFHIVRWLDRHWAVAAGDRTGAYVFIRCSGDRLRRIPRSGGAVGRRVVIYDAVDLGLCVEDWVLSLRPDRSHATGGSLVMARHGGGEAPPCG